MGGSAIERGEKMNPRKYANVCAVTARLVPPSRESDSYRRSQRTSEMVNIDREIEISRLFEANYTDLLRFAALLGAEGYAEDIVAEAFCELYRRWQRHLPVRQREVLVHRYWLGFTETEVAKALGISVGSVKVHASRGMSRLAQALAELRLIVDRRARWRGICGGKGACTAAVRCGL
jgi:hypothetical protein